MTLVFPGQALGAAAEYAPGVGTHLANAQICASILGAISEGDRSDLSKLNGARKSEKAPDTESSQKPLLSVLQKREIPTASPATEANILPTVNSIVLARVTRINPRHATADILVVGDKICAQGFRGLVRVQDVRATEKDKVKIAESFRPGDIIRATVISLGDQSNYYLSTASNLLGVVMASGDAGNAMYPISWKEFRDPITGASENRKVAKPF